MPSKFHLLLNKYSIVLLFAVCSCCTGCQSWHSSTALPSMKTTREQQKILNKLEHDPFPTPSDVGMQGAE